MDSNRRKFIKQSCGLCASLVGIGLVLPALSACSPLTSIKTNLPKGKINVATSLFTAENNLVLIKNEAQEFDIALVKLPNGTYRAFEMQCTHQTNPLIPTKKGFFCNAHGSSFSFDGKVQKPPAEKNLKEYKTEFTNDNITVEI